MAFWHYPHITKSELYLMSGWKIYILGNTVKDANIINNLLLPVVINWDLTFKIATDSLIRRNKDLSIAWSSAIIYLDPLSITRFHRLITDIMANLRTYNKEDNITGAKRLNRLLFIRYDLRIPINPVEGVIYDDYYSLYRGEYGSYNIPGNQCII